MPAKPDSILAVDPGLNNPAAAIFRFGKLVAASRVKLPAAWKKLDVAERCRLIAGRVHEWASANGVDEAAMVRAYELELAGDLAGAETLRQARGVVRLTIEYPQIYPAGKQKGDPNDLLPLVGVAMCLAGRLDIPVQSFKPREWIGQVPKTETGDPWQSARGQLIWRNLEPAERAAVVPSHDAVDSVGIGLHSLGRLRRRVYPRS